MSKNVRKSATSSEIEKAGLIVEFAQQILEKGIEFKCDAFTMSSDFFKKFNKASVLLLEAESIADDFSSRNLFRISAETSNAAIDEQRRFIKTFMADKFPWLFWEDCNDDFVPTLDSEGYYAEF